MASATQSPAVMFNPVSPATGSRSGNSSTGAKGPQVTPVEWEDIVYGAPEAKKKQTVGNKQMGKSGGGAVDQKAQSAETTRQTISASTLESSERDSGVEVPIVPQAPPVVINFHGKVRVNFGQKVPVAKPEPDKPESETEEEYETASSESRSPSCDSHSNSHSASPSTSRSASGSSYSPSPEPEPARKHKKDGKSVILAEEKNDEEHECRKHHKKSQKDDSGDEAEQNEGSEETSKKKARAKKGGKRAIQVVLDDTSSDEETQVTGGPIRTTRASAGLRARRPPAGRRARGSKKTGRQ